MIGRICCVPEAGQHPSPETRDTPPIEGTQRDSHEGKDVPSEFNKFRIRSWQSIIESDTPPPESVVENLIEEGSTTLLIARQKEGKSMLAAQMVIDVGAGEPFLGICKTKPGPVLYIDYENRTHRVKSRGMDLAKGRDVNNVYFAAFDRISERNLGLDGEQLEGLKAAVRVLKPILLVIDPLRLATCADLTDASKVVPILERTSQLQDVCPDMAVLLIHHLKKGQSEMSKSLRDDPRDWIERAFGSQALLAHVENIIGLEQDRDREYTLATVPRSYEPIVWVLEKEPDSQRYMVAKPKCQLDTWPIKLKLHWRELPDEFSWTEGEKLVGNSTIDRIVRKAKPLLLTQDPKTKRYRKVVDSISKGEKDDDR